MKHSKLLNQDFKDNLILYKAERNEINKRSLKKIQNSVEANKTATIMERALRSKAALDAVMLAFEVKN